MSITIRLATAADLDNVLTLLNDTSAWLKSRGLNQWGNGFGPERIGPMVDRREVYIVHDGDTPIATAAASMEGDADFWTPTELDDNAIYLSKVTVARDRTGEGLGEMLFRWLVDRAARDGIDLVRLDAWRTNGNLHAYYERTGWTYVRTVERDWRRSGALFTKPAALDNEAWMAFLYTGTPLNADERYEAGASVLFDVDGRTECGQVMSSYAEDWYPERETRPAAVYAIQVDGRRFDRGHHEVRRPAGRTAQVWRQSA